MMWKIPINTRMYEKNADLRHIFSDKLLYEKKVTFRWLLCRNWRMLTTQFKINYRFFQGHYHYTSLVTVGWWEIILAWSQPDKALAACSFPSAVMKNWNTPPWYFLGELRLTSEMDRDTSASQARPLTIPHFFFFFLGSIWTHEWPKVS